MKRTADSDRKLNKNLTDSLKTLEKERQYIWSVNREIIRNAEGRVPCFVDYAKVFEKLGCKDVSELFSNLDI